MSRRGALLVAVAITFATSAGVRAQEPAFAPRTTPGREAEWAVSLAASGGGMVTSYQIEQLRFYGGGGSLRLGVHARPFDSLGIDWIEGELRGGVTVVAPGTDQLGGIADVQLGARVAPRIDDVRPYLAIGVGVCVTGPFVRPIGSAALGIVFRATEELGVAPELSVLHVIDDDQPGGDDAVMLSFGLALTYRPVSHPPVVPDVEREPVEPGEPFVERERVIREVVPVPTEELLRLVDRAVPGSTLRVVLLVPPVLFDHDQSALTAAGEVAMHDVLERAMAADPSARIIIEGHADLTGDPDHNLVLSRQRAAVVGAWLVAHGIARERIRESGEGATQPLVVGDDVPSLAPNRRVTIRIEVDAPAESDAIDAPAIEVAQPAEVDAPTEVVAPVEPQPEAP